MEVITLSPLDQLAPACHVGIACCFPLPDGSDIAAICQHLQNGLDMLAVSLPTVKGRIRPRRYPGGDNTGPKGFLDLEYHKDDLGPKLLVRQLGNEVPHYQELRQDVFYLHTSDRYGFGPCCITCQDTTGCSFGSVLNVQANFIRGGLILFLCFHHTAFDATACGTVTRLYAAHCSGRVDTTLLNAAATPRLPASYNLPYEIALQRVGPLVGPRKDVVPGQDSRPIAYSVFRISTEALQRLKATVSSSLPQDGPARWISTLDAVNALLWTCVARARAPLIGHGSTTCTLDIAVNIRGRVLEQPLPAEYLGNCVQGSFLCQPLSALTESGRLPEVAASIRASYDDKDDQLLRASVTMVNAEPDMGLYHLGPPAPASYFNITSWAVTTVYADFGGALEVPEYVSAVCGVGQNGQCVIQPRKPEQKPRLNGDSKGGAEALGALEFCLCIESEVVDRLEKDDEWTTWVELVHR